MDTINWGVSPTDLSTALGGMTLQGVYRILKQHNFKANTGTRRLVKFNEVRDILSSRSFEYPNKNYSFQIVKGGAGKTSLSSNFALRASQYGAKVLAIDFDQQGNFTSTFGINTKDRPVFINLFRKEVTVEESIVAVNDALHIIPSSLDNSRLDVELTQRPSLNIRDLIKDILEPVRNKYDIIVMDCPPAINRINVAVTCGSDYVVIPVNPDQYSMDGLEFTIAELINIRKDFKIHSLDYFIVWNKYDARERLGAQYMHYLVKDSSKVSKILPVVIRTDASIKNVVYEMTTIFERGKKTTIKEDIDHFTREVLGINAWSEIKIKEKREAGIVV
jgi:chromosome partitioning protein